MIEAASPCRRKGFVMAASDYNGKEKASLNNIKEMVANATSLEELRGNMGLGRSLGVLAVANGGTGHNEITDNNQLSLYLQQQESQLTGDEPIFASNLLTAINILNGVFYPIGALLASASLSNKKSASGLHPSLAANMTPTLILADGVDGISVSGNKITLTKPGMYYVECSVNTVCKASGFKWGADWNGSTNWTIVGSNVKNEQMTSELGTVKLCENSFSTSFNSSSTKTMKETEHIIVAKEGGTDSTLTFTNNNALSLDASTASGSSTSLSVSSTVKIQYNDGLKSR